MSGDLLAYLRAYGVLEGTTILFEGYKIAKPQAGRVLAPLPGVQLPATRPWSGAAQDEGLKQEGTAAWCGGSFL